MDTPDYFDKLWRIVDGLNERFPNGNSPFQIVARLCEEAGEVASAVNHFEGSGVKRQKHGEPDKAVLAKEVQDVIRAIMAIARYYSIEDDLKGSIDSSYHRLRDEGYIR